MAAKRNTGLGRGLDQIFADNIPEEEEVLGTVTLRISEIEPRPDQPRKVFDPEALAALADSIAANGLIQPLVVRKLPTGFYQIIAGERRWRASKMAGLTEVPAIVMEADDRKASELALIENIQRESLNPIEEASALKALIDEYALTQEEISKRVGRSRSAVTNSLRLLDLPPKTMQLVSSGDLSVGHAKVLLGLPDEKLDAAAEMIVRKGLSVRAAETLVKGLSKTAAKNGKKTALPTVDYYARIAGRMSGKLGRKVCISHSGGAKKIEITYSDDRDLEEAVKELCGAHFFEEEDI